MARVGGSSGTVLFFVFSRRIYKDHQEDLRRRLNPGFSLENLGRVSLNASLAKSIIKS